MWIKHNKVLISWSRAHILQILVGFRDHLGNTSSITINYCQENISPAVEQIIDVVLLLLLFLVLFPVVFICSNGIWLQLWRACLPVELMYCRSKHKDWQVLRCMQPVIWARSTTRMAQSMNNGVLFMRIQVIYWQNVMFQRSFKCQK